jgi:anaerobic magnesium-protoporphyrin IX monomethyl ester cyclase
MIRNQHSPDVLLGHSLFLRHDAKQFQRMRPYPPLATLLAAATLRQRGSAVHLFDATFATGVDDFCHMLDDLQPAIVAIVEDNFNFVTKMCTAQMRRDALAMVRAAQQRGCHVVVNGSDATDHAPGFLAAGAGAVIVGEVEPTLCELVDAWSSDRTPSLDDIAGLALPAFDGATGSVRRTAPRRSYTDLDHLPFPAWDLVDHDAYGKAWREAHGRLSWNMVTSRGCPYGCNWCAKPLWGRRYSQRSPELVAQELALLGEQIAPDHVWFADDIFGLTAPWIEAFAAQVRARSARVPFMMQSRVNLMQARTVAALADAGAEEVWLGVESGSQMILDSMNKGSTLEQIATATRALKEHGIRCCWFVMLGYLGEAWPEILNTRDLIRDLRPDDIGVSVAYPLPGTVFYERVRAELGAQRNWHETDDLAMLFPGTYETEFYRRVRDVLHAEVSGAQRTALDERWHELELDEAAARRPRRTPQPAANA